VIVSTTPPPASRDGEQREDDQPDGARDQAHVAQQVVLARPVAEQQHSGEQQQWPVAEDVDPVRQPNEGVVAEDRRLRRSLPVDPEEALDVSDPAGVGQRLRDLAFGERPHAEVGQVGGREDRALADAAPAVARAER
jgi:hypothetical protein